ncbi:tetratricopeptide repeat protein [Archangium sp.]|jgi:tetratricopeptide (TPR) repeat protein|uniref:tetratricopeptide repeat protein n=1 Tax=Archangium sp. TaxID=1872627 RepID=UPI002ED8C725
MTSQNINSSVPPRERASQIAREGQKLLESHQYPEAICQFDGALAVGLDPQADKKLLAWIHTHRGLAWLQLGIPRDAVSAFNKALDFDPSYIRALAYRGEAVRCYVRDNLPALETRGLHWAYIADILADFKAAEQADPSSKNAWLAAHHGAAWALAQFTAQHVPLVFTASNIELSGKEDLFPIRVRSSVEDIKTLAVQAQVAPSKFADNAESYFKRACDFKSTYGWSYAFWAFSLTLRSTRKDHFYEEAKQKLELAKKHGLGLEILATQGLFKLLSYKGAYIDALNMAIQALNLNPQDPFAPYFIATSLHHIAEQQKGLTDEASWKHMARDATATARKRLETVRLMVQLMEMGLDRIAPRVAGPSEVPVQDPGVALRLILSRRDPEAVCLVKNDPTLAQFHDEPWFQQIWDDLHQSPEPKNPVQ